MRATHPVAGPSERPTAEDLVSDGVNVHVRDGEALVRIGEMDVSTATDPECDHSYWLDGNRLIALEPHPKSGVWECCPCCGLMLGQRNLGEVPLPLR